MKICKTLLGVCLLAITLCACTSNNETNDPAYESENIEIKSMRDTNIKATLVTPSKKTDEKIPFVIFAHGFQGSRDESGAFREVAQGLAENGIASIRFDFPGCNESEEDFMQYTLENMQNDVTSVLQYAKEQVNIDEERLGILGYSMGGRVASLYLDDANFKTAVLWAPAAANGLDALQAMGSEEEILATIESAKETGVGHVKLWGQEIQVSYDFLKQSMDAKPLEVLNAYKGNMLIINGGNDTTVAPSIVEEALQAAQNTTITANLNIPRAKHSLGAGEFGNDPEVQALVVKETVHFFSDYLAK